MTPPAPRSYILPSSFTYSNWEIRYALLSPATTSKPSDLSQHSAPTKTRTKIKTLLFIHGTPWSSAVFQPLAQSLLASWAKEEAAEQEENDNGGSSSSKWQILIYDLPGYGQSQHHLSTEQSSPAGNTSIASQSLALSALLSHLDLIPTENQVEGKKELHVLAHDIAGSIALHSHLLPQRIESPNHPPLPITSLMLLDTNCVLPWGDGFYNLVRENPEVFRQMPGHVHDAVVRAVVRSGSSEPASLTGGGATAGWEDVLAKPWIGRDGQGQEGFVRQIAQADDGDVGAMCGVEGGAETAGRCLYGDVQFSVRILWGSGDTWIPREKMELLRELLDGGERKVVEKFAVIEGAGHLVMLDRPEEVEREVREWLGMGM